MTGSVDSTSPPSGEVMAETRRRHAQRERADVALISAVVWFVSLAAVGYVLDEQGANADGVVAGVGVALVLVLTIVWPVALLVWFIGLVVALRRPKDLRASAKAWRAQARLTRQSPWPGRVPDACHTRVGAWLGFVACLAFTLVLGYRALQGALTSLGIAGTKLAVHVTGYTASSRGFRLYQGIVQAPSAQAGRTVVLETGSRDGNYYAWPTGTNQVWPHGALLWLVSAGLTLALIGGDVVLARWLARRLALRRAWRAEHPADPNGASRAAAERSAPP